MTRSGAPFHGAHGEGRSAISPAASQTDAEPCACAFPAAISDNAVVAAPMNWRAESTGNPLPLSRPATQLAENHGKSRSPGRLAFQAVPSWIISRLKPGPGMRCPSPSDVLAPTTARLRASADGVRGGAHNRARTTMLLRGGQEARIR